MIGGTSHGSFGARNGLQDVLGTPSGCRFDVWGNQEKVKKKNGWHIVHEVLRFVWTLGVVQLVFIAELNCFQQWCFRGVSMNTSASSALPGAKEMDRSAFPLSVARLLGRNLEPPLVSSPPSTPREDEATHQAWQKQGGFLPRKSYSFRMFWGDETHWQGVVAHRFLFRWETSLMSKWCIGNA